MLIKSIFDVLNQAEQLNARSVLRSIKVIYFFLILGLLSFFAVTFLISQDFKFAFDKSDPVIFANIELFLLVVPVGFLVAQTMWKRIEKDLPLMDKLLKSQIGF